MWRFLLPSVNPSFSKMQAMISYFWPIRGALIHIISNIQTASEIKAHSVLEKVIVVYDRTFHNEGAKAPKLYSNSDYEFSDYGVAVTP